MAQREDLLKESIAKLISLNVSDDEIILNLKEVGLTESEAKEILEQTKREKDSGKVKSVSESEPEEESNDDSKEDTEEVIEEEGEKEDGSKEVPEDENDFSKEDAYSTALKEAEKDLKESKEKKDYFSSLTKKPVQSKKDSEVNSLDIWERGIMATVNSKLSEMEKMKKDMQSTVNEKVQKGLSKEIMKIETVFESQRSLGAAKINDALEKKSKEVEKMIDTKISELNKTNHVSEELIKKLEAQKKENEKALLQLNEKIEEVSKAKKKIVSEFSAELASSKAMVQNFLEESDAKRKETVQRINRSLELESKIVEGLMNDAKQKVDALALEKSGEIEKELLSKFQKQKKDLDKKSGELEAIAQKIDSLALQKSGEIESEVLAKFEEQRKSLDKRVQELNVIAQKVDPSTIKNTMEELDIFREQFASQIKKSVDSFNSSKKDLTELIKKREGLIDKQLEILRLKIKEFEAFESEFAQKMGGQIDLLAEKKKALSFAKKHSRKKAKKIVKKTLKQPLESTVTALKKNVFSGEKKIKTVVVPKKPVVRVIKPVLETIKPAQAKASKPFVKPVIKPVAKKHLKPKKKKSSDFLDKMYPKESETLFVPKPKLVAPKKNIEVESKSSEPAFESPKRDLRDIIKKKTRE